MTASVIAQKALKILPDDWQEALRSACNQVAPVWPLNQWIAVNPFWGLKHLPAHWADSVLSQRGGVSILPPRDFYRAAWSDGRITSQNLRDSLGESHAPEDEESLIRWLRRPASPVTRSPHSILDLFDDSAEGLPMAHAVQDQIGRVCAAYFDRRQAGWSAASAEEGLYEYWLTESQADVALDTLTGVAGARETLKSLPITLDDAAPAIVQALGCTGKQLEALAHSWLLAVNGWSSWCRGEDWRSGLEGRPSDRLWELVVITLAWEMIGYKCATPEVQASWSQRLSTAARIQQPARHLWIWHRAYEIGYQQRLWQALGDALDTSPECAEAGPDEPAAATTPAFQAVFCIDVRSEVMRRHLETVCADAQTLGFAGFFGLPVEHQSHGPFSPVRRLPGLLSAPYRLVDTLGSQRDDHQANRGLDQKEIARDAVRSAKYGSLSTFTLVETTGLAWAWKLVRDSLRRPARKSSASSSEHRLVHRVGGDPLTDAEKAELVAGILRGMSLTDGFSPLLVFVGHGSRTDNNPHHAGLECGACGGQSGGTNARLAATLFNERPVRAKLAEMGIRIPGFVWAMAAEHCTLTDEITLLDEASVPETHRVRLSQMKKAFAEAGAGARRERAQSLGLNGDDDHRLIQQMSTRGNDWAEVRPEWGLANNAAIIFAKRSRSRGANLGGRVFLHDYDEAQDESGEVLAALLTAPMVVANWINMQYFASVSTPEVYGAGNKLLHSVVGGNVGVIEGNSPQLRIGLPMQSVHDGTHWRHEPVRLTVVIDAAAERIEAVLHQHQVVAELVENRWVSLCRMAKDGFEQYQNGEWVPASGQALG